MLGETLVTNPSTQRQTPRREEAARGEDPELNLLSVKVDEPWYTSLIEQIRERINPPKLPPLELTSKPVEVRSIWGDYQYGRVSSLSSILVHTVAISLLLIISAHKVVQVVKENVHLIMPLDI